MILLLAALAAAAPRLDLLPESVPKAGGRIAVQIQWEGEATLELKRGPRAWRPVGHASSPWTGRLRPGDRARLVGQDLLGELEVPDRLDPSDTRRMLGVHPTCGAATDLATDRRAGAWVDACGLHGWGHLPDDWQALTTAAAHPAALAIDAQGGWWVGGGRTVWRLDRHGLASFPVAEDVRELAALDRGAAVLSGLGLQVILGPRGPVTPHQDLGEVSALRPGPQGTLWMRTDRTLVRWRDGYQRAWAGAIGIDDLAGARRGVWLAGRWGLEWQEPERAVRRELTRAAFPGRFVAVAEASGVLWGTREDGEVLAWSSRGLSRWSVPGAHRLVPDRHGAWVLTEDGPWRLILPAPAPDDGLEVLAAGRLPR